MSLKSAILTIEIEPLSETLIAREAQLTAWLKLMGKDTTPKLVARRSRASGYEAAKDYESPEEYDVYAGYGLSTVPSALRDQVRGLLVGGRKIEAIKLVRERMGWALSQAKEAVEALQ